MIVVISMANYLSFSQPWTYQRAMAKKATVKISTSRSHMQGVSGVGQRLDLVLAQRPSPIDLIKGRCH
jgi:hypothetical protein